MTNLITILFTLILLYQAPPNHPVDTSRSVIRWKGTKMLKTGKHEGTINLKSGTIAMRNGKLTGGQFVVDMNSIRVTDIPPTDPVPIRNIIAHLKEEFSTADHPEARFVISSVRYLSNDQMTITGTMTIRNISKAITIPASSAVSGNAIRFKSAFQISRPDFGIGAKGNWLEKRMVDDEISLDLDLRCDTRR